MKTSIVPKKEALLPPKLKVTRPPRKAVAQQGPMPHDVPDCLYEIRRRFERRRDPDIKRIAPANRLRVSAVIIHTRILRGQDIDPVKRRAEKMRLYNATFLKLREISNGLNIATQQATGLYRELAGECRRLLILGVDKQILTRELIDSGRTASRASELLSVAALSDGQFEHFLSGEMTWKLALTSSRMTPEFCKHWDSLALSPDERSALQDAAKEDAHSEASEGDDPLFRYAGSSPTPLQGRDQPSSLLGSSPPPVQPKPLPMSLTLGEQKAVAVARLRLELVKLAKLSRRSFIESATEYEIGGFKITIEPLKQ